MDHSEATGNHFAEKYLLNELESAEKELFEEHFFTCALCAAEVKAGAVFADNLRSVAGDGVRHPFASPQVPVAIQPAGWAARLREFARQPSWVPALAASAFGAIAITQTLVTIPGLKSELAGYQSARDVPTFALHAAARGDEATFILPPHSQLFTVYFDIAWSRPPAGFACEVLDASNRRRAELRDCGRAGSETVHLEIPASGLKSGPYTLVIRGNSSPPEELRRYEFNLVKQ